MEKILLPICRPKQKQYILFEVVEQEGCGGLCGGARYSLQTASESNLGIPHIDVSEEVSNPIDGDLDDDPLKLGDDLLKTDSGLWKIDQADDGGDPLGDVDVDVERPRKIARKIGQAGDSSGIMGGPSNLYDDLLDMIGGTISIQKPLPLVIRCHSIPNRTYAIMGDTIFALGGISPRAIEDDVGITRRHSLRNVYSCRTGPIAVWSPVWCPSPSMIVGRVKPLTAILRGKLYVFGGFYMSAKDPFAEVFDPDLQVWQPLPELARYCEDARTATAAMVCDTKETIVLLNRGYESLFIFSPQCNTWKLLDFIRPTIKIWKYSCRNPVMVGDTIFYCVHHQLHAYYISCQEWLWTDIPGLPTDDIRFSSLIHMGKLGFSLLWWHDDKVHLTRFQVSRESGTDTFKVDVESDKFFCFEDGEDVTFDDALLMSGVAQERGLLL